MVEYTRKVKRRLRAFTVCMTFNPATFETLMILILRGLTWKISMVYLDDVIVMYRDFEEHMKDLQKVSNKFRAANLKLNPTNVQFSRRNSNLFAIRCRRKEYRYMMTRFR